MNRYEFDGELVEMTQHENGEWVRYEDARLEQSPQTGQAEASSLSDWLERFDRLEKEVNEMFTEAEKDDDKPLLAINLENVLDYLAVAKGYLPE